MVASGAGGGARWQPPGSASPCRLRGDLLDPAGSQTLALDDASMPTISVENYLKAVFHLQGDTDERVKTKALAEHLDISLPSVTGMLKSLADEGLVDYVPYRGALLSEAGRRMALRVIRNHRLIEVFLMKTLDYSWDEVHAEAERLEHAVSDTLVARIEQALGFPRFDPHGDPIPSADGEILRRDVMPLSAATAGMRVRVERVLDQTPEVLRYLDRIGLRPGGLVYVREVLSFDGQMFLTLNNEDVSVSESLAAKMLVTEVSPT
ncbi:metal-dependent transcriptional regulator [Bradymonadaceae bacterium TMQ3]|nr:metal-dependent transcriptional regulator [Bradymonadaceae bacterium TMQ3]TXC78002.1 metal-dependent transcriptional regulator [Bradymonadales bacterium TMQ1]